MITTALYNMEGEKIGEVELSDNVFNVPMNADLVYQVAVTQAANGRKVIAHTKDRGEVSGGGKKPWKQKGTGRSRHGSSRSPIWRHGGITFGPTKERNFSGKVNDKMKKKAVSIILSSKLKDNELIVLDKFILPEPKTKIVNSAFEKLSLKGKKTLLATAKEEQDIKRAVKNLPKAKVVSALNVNVGDLLSYKYLVIPKDAVEVLQKRVSL